MNSASALKLAVLAGAATSLGALPVYCINSVSPGIMALVLGLAAGVMITVSVFDLIIPVASEHGVTECAAATSLGFALCIIGLRWCHPSREKQMADKELDLAVSGKKNFKAREWELSLVMMFTLMAHNFPEGLAVAATSLSSEKLGIEVATAVAVHNIPEGLTIAIPFFSATGNRHRAFAMATLSGISEPLGAAVSLLFLQPFLESHPEYVGYTSACVGGIMTAVSVKELLPQAMSYGYPIHLIMGLIIGSLVIFFTMSFGV
eukprot:m.9298 g.9298  ORF g.9298 m.9298 type:complete len:262 (-) comp4039_c0_seq2:1326-2111(-)